MKRLQLEGEIEEARKKEERIRKDVAWRLEECEKREANCHRFIERLTAMGMVSKEDE
jgi:hypothetical protein